jgi:electron transfer flavoprotein alpha subunit
MSGIWVYAELGPGGVPDRSAFELLTKARSLDADVEAVVLGRGATEAAALVGEYGAKCVYVADDAVYDEYLAEPAAHVLAQLVERHDPELILFGASYDSRDIAGRLQGLLGCTLLTNVDDLITSDRALMRVALSVWPGRPGNLQGGIGGTKLVDVTLTGRTPRLVIPRAKAFDSESSGGSSRMVSIDIAVPEELRRARRVQRHEETDVSGPTLDDARVVVAGGRGLQDQRHLALIRDLADAIGNAAVGVSRPLVDAGWAPFHMQIGQTGTTVKPDVYIAVGISGATQHVVGMKGSKRILAINRDKDAPIFQLADLGIVGDALTIVPSVVEELTRESGAPAR